MTLQITTRVLGNHDYSYAGISKYTSFFTLPGNERYYTFSDGNVQFFMINSNSQESDGINSSSIQAQWLQTQLASSTAKWKLVLMHHPPYSSGDEHGSTPEMKWPYKEWGATAVIAGHDHVYERIIRNDFPYFVNGLGGKSLYDVKSTPVTGSEVRFNTNYGAMKVDANETTITFKFITRAGVVRDTYELVSASASTPNPTPTGASCYWSPDAIHSETELQNAINSAKQSSATSYVGRADHNKVANITAVNSTSQGSYDDITLLCIDGRWYFSQYQHENLIYKDGATIVDSNKASWGAYVAYQPNTYGEWRIVDNPDQTGSWKKYWAKQTTSPPPTTCTDSDGGKVYLVKGNVVVAGFSGGPPDSFAEDNCQSTSVLVEQFCNGDSASSENYTCPSGTTCSNGACIYVSGAACTDSDGGKDYFVKGTATRTGEASQVDSDNCMSSTILREVYCNGNILSEENYNCPVGCSTGACNNPTTEPPSGECTIANPAQPVNFDYESLSGGALSITFTHTLAVGDRYGVEIINKIPGRVPESVYLCSNFTRTITSANTQTFDCIWDSNKSAVNPEDYLESGTYFANVYIAEGESEVLCDSEPIAYIRSKSEGPSPVLPGVLCNLPDGKTIPAKARFRDAIDNGLKYCSFEGGTPLAQKGTGDSCSNDFECQTNLCTDGVCTSLQETTSLLRKIWCALVNPADFLDRGTTYNAENDWWSCVLPTVDQEDEGEEEENGGQQPSGQTYCTGTLNCAGLSSDDCDLAVTYGKCVKTTDGVCTGTASCTGISVSDCAIFDGVYGCAEAATQ